MALELALASFNGDLTPEELRSAILHALFGMPEAWCDPTRQPLIRALNEALNWLVVHRVPVVRDTLIEDTEMAERVFFHAYRREYTGGEAASYWPEALPRDATYSRRLLVHVGTAVAQHDNRCSMDLAEFYAASQTTGDSR